MIYRQCKGKSVLVRCRAALGLLLGLSTLSAPVLAQQVDLNPLGSAGQTVLQQNTGQAIMTTCGSFAANQVDQAATNAAEQNLLADKCTELVATALDVQGLNTADALNSQLGINADQLAAALQQMAGEEIAAAGTLATESTGNQAALVGQRLAAILSRTTTLQVSAAGRGNGGLIMLASADELTGGGAADGDDDITVPPVSIFASVIGGGGSKDATDTEDGFDSMSSAIAFGADYNAGNIVAGGMLTIASQESDFDTTPTVAGGDLEATLASLSAYSIFFKDNYYIDGVMSFGTGSYEMSRNIVVPAVGDLTNDAGSPNDGFNGRARAETDSTQFRASIGGGMEIVNGRMVFAPFARLSALTVNVDEYAETGAGGLDLRVEEQDIRSVTSGVGMRFVSTFSTSHAIVSPQISAEWVHEFQDDERRIVSTFVNDPRADLVGHQLVFTTDEPDSDYFVLGVGVTSVFSNGVHLFADLKTLGGLERISDTVLSAGVRYSFR